MVEIVIVDPRRHSSERPDPGHDVSLMLSRHGAETEVLILPNTLPRISDMTLRHATDSSAGLMVMGAYGHSCFQDTVFGRHHTPDAGGVGNSAADGALSRRGG